MAEKEPLIRTKDFIGLETLSYIADDLSCCRFFGKKMLTGLQHAQFKAVVNVLLLESLTVLCEPRTVYA